MSTTHHVLHHTLYTLIPVHVLAFPYFPPAPAPPPPGQAAVMTGVMLRAVFFSILAEMSSRPLALDSGAPAVVMGEKVYVRGGDTEEVEDRHHVFQYNTSRDKWSCVSHHTGATKQPSPQWGVGYQTMTSLLTRIPGVG